MNNFTSNKSTYLRLLSRQLDRLPTPWYPFTRGPNCDFVPPLILGRFVKNDKACKVLRPLSSTFLLVKPILNSKPSMSGCNGASSYSLVKEINNMRHLSIK